MTNASDIQVAMLEWRAAFIEMSDYFDNNDILAPECYARWNQLREHEADVRVTLDHVIEEVRRTGG